MLNCVIIDDEERNINKLKGYVEQMDCLRLCFATTNPIEGMKYIEANEPDLIFLDIEMEDLTGMDLAKKLKNKKKVVFITASKDHTLDAFEVGVLDYILKPFGFARFEVSVQKALEYQRSQQESEASVGLVKPSTDLFLKGEVKGQLTRLRLEDIYYVEGRGNYLVFHTKNGVQMALITFRDLEERLAFPQFIRIHKSFIVAYDHIVAIEGGEIVVRTDKKTVNIPIGGSYRERFLQLIQGQ